jgi:hypothetical protein
MKRIVSWVVEVEWEDGTTEKVADIPSHVANEVDGFLTMLEDERNEEGEDDAN